MRSPHIVEVNDANFQREVVDFSEQTPVVIDFWATWCAPCRTLGPTLESLAEAYEGQFRLAKVDVDRSPQLASAARVQSIPMVVAVYQGQFLDQFVGALPKAEVRRFIDGVLAKAGVPAQRPAERAPTDPAAAEAHWRAKLETDPEDGRALLELGRVLASRGAVDQARTVLEKIKPAKDEHSTAQTLLDLLGLLDEVAKAGGVAAIRERLAANPEDPRARYLAACVDAGRGDVPRALHTFVDLVSEAKGDVHEDAKRAAAVVLASSGRDDPRVEAERRRLASVLY